MPRNWNRKLYRVHQWLGLVTGLFLLLLSVTGVLLVFADELDHALNAELLKVNPAETRASYDEMLRAVQQAFPGERVRGFRNLPRSPEDAVTLAVDHNKRYWFVHVNPYTGSLLGDRDADKGFVRSMLLLHYSLWVRPWGEMLVCLLGFTLLGSVGTGAWIYRHSLTAVFRRGVRTRQGWRPFAADLHRLVGVGSLLFNVVIAVTGIWMLLPVFASTFGTKSATSRPASPPISISVDAALETARIALPNFVPASLWLPEPADGNILVYGRVPGNILHSDYSSSVSIDPQNGEVVETINANRADFATQWQAIVGPLHFGNWGGLTIKVLYALFGVSPGLLSLTGFGLWLVRRQSRTAVQTLTARTFEYSGRAKV